MERQLHKHIQEDAQQLQRQQWRESQPPQQQEQPPPQRQQKAGPQQEDSRTHMRCHRGRDATEAGSHDVTGAHDSGVHARAEVSAVSATGSSSSSSSRQPQSGTPGRIRLRRKGSDKS